MTAVNGRDRRRGLVAFRSGPPVIAKAAAVGTYAVSDTTRGTRNWGPAVIAMEARITKAFMCLTSLCGLVAIAITRGVVAHNNADPMLTAVAWTATRAAIDYRASCSSPAKITDAPPYMTSPMATAEPSLWHLATLSGGHLRDWRDLSAGTLIPVYRDFLARLASEARLANTNSGRGDAHATAIAIARTCRLDAAEQAREARGTVAFALKAAPMIMTILLALFREAGFPFKSWNAETFAMLAYPIAIAVARTRWRGLLVTRVPAKAFVAKAFSKDAEPVV